MKLREVVNIKPILRVIDFQSEDKNLIDEYVIMDQTVEYFTKILEGFTQVRDEETTSKEGSIQPGRADRCHKITGTYGVGKSYFILMLRAMLESLEDENSYNSIMHKFGDFKSVAYQLEILKREAKKYIVISINGKSFSELDFKSLIEDRVYKTILEKIGRENLNFDSFFESTVNQLEEWRKTNSVLYKVFEEKFRDDIDYTYDEMIEDLAKRENGAKEKYIKVYKDIINREPSNTFDSLDKFLDEANENVINNGYDGIVILFDEFSTYLRSRAEKGYLNIDLGSIDILAERTIPSSTRKIHFITTEHEDIEKILEKVLDNMDTVKKTAGRFKNYTLHFEKGAQLVQSVVAKNDNKFKLVKFENSNIFDEYSKVNDYAQLSDIYPINPFTLEYLVKISEKYAQGDRTLFSFIDEKLRAFVETNNVLLKDNHLNLLSVDAIMETFETDILNGREELAKAYNTQIERAKSNLQKRVVRALALDYAVTITDVGKIRSGINNENIGYILSLPEEETKEVRAYLLGEQNNPDSYIIFNEGTNGYELSPDTQGIDIEEEINKELKNTNEIRMLENLILNRSMALDIKNEFIIPKGAKVFPFERTIEGRFIKSLGELKGLNIEDELNNCKGDGKIIFYIPPAGQSYDYSVVLKVAENKIKGAQSNRLAIAVPKTFNFFGNESIMLKRYEAIQRLTKKENIMSNPKAADLIRLEIVRLRTQIYGNLSHFGRSENFVFLFKNEVLSHVDNMQQMLVDWLANKIYTKFPTVDVEDFSSRAPSNQLIQNLIIPRKAEKINLNSTKVLSKQIRDTLRPLDLVKLIETPHGFRVEIKEPVDNAIMKEIFEILEEPEEKLTIKEKYELLVSSPYGLNEPLFEIFFALFIQLSSDKYYLQSKEGARIEVTPDNINSLWNKEYELCVTKDAVSFNIKKDAINILEVIDKAYSLIQSYKQLNPADPSDKFSELEKLNVFAYYIDIFQQKIKIFLDSLKFLEIDTPAIEKMGDIKNYLEKTRNMFNPTDMLNSVSSLIDIYFSNNITLDETGDINILRYEKLQNFLDNTKWVDNNKDILKKQYDITNKLSSMARGINFLSIADAVQDVKDRLNDILYNQIALDNWKDSKYENNIQLDKLQSDIDDAIAQHNSKYKECHDILNIEKNNLIAVMEDNKNIPLIKSLEQINFVDVKKLEFIKEQLGRIKVCDYNFNDDGTDIFMCDNCGGLDQIVASVDNIKQKQNNIEKELYEILKNYIDELDRLVDLDEVKAKYNQDETIIDYIRGKYPGKSERIVRLIGNIRDSWEDNINSIIELVDELYPVINEYIKPSPIVVPAKEISYRKIINKINDLIRFSGYKKMSFKQFEKEIIKELKELGEKFGGVTISD